MEPHFDYRKLEEVMIERGISIPKLAEMVGVNAPVVYRWRNGSIPNAANIMKLTEKLGLPANYFSKHAIDERSKLFSTYERITGTDKEIVDIIFKKYGYE